MKIIEFGFRVMWGIVQIVEAAIRHSWTHFSMCIILHVILSLIQ